MNYVLHIFSFLRDQLLVCGSIFAGTCDLLKLSNVAEPYEPNPGVTELKCHPESKVC